MFSSNIYPAEHLNLFYVDATLLVRCLIKTHPEEGLTSISIHFHDMNLIKQKGYKSLCIINQNLYPQIICVQ